MDQNEPRNFLSLFFGLSLGFGIWGFFVSLGSWCVPGKCIEIHRTSMKINEIAENPKEINDICGTSPNIYKKSSHFLTKKHGALLKANENA